jgi:hypothetical protein
MKWILCYWFPQMSSSERIQFKRALFGSQEKVQQGKYDFYKKGYLTDKVYEKPIRSVLILDEQDVSKVEKIILQFKGEFKKYKLAQE